MRHRLNGTSNTYINIVLFGLTGLVMAMLGGFVLSICTLLVARLLDISPLIQEKAFVPQFTEAFGVVGYIAGTVFAIILERAKTRAQKGN